MDVHKIQVLIQSLFEDKGIKKAEAETSKSVNNIKKLAKGLIINPKVETTEFKKKKAELAKTLNDISKLGEKMKVTPMHLETQELIEARSKTVDLHRALANASKEYKAMLSGGTAMASDIDKAKRKVDMLASAYKRAKSEELGIEGSGRGYTPNMQYMAQAKQMDYLKRKAEELGIWIDRAVKTGAKFQAWTPILTPLQQRFARLTSAVHSLVNGVRKLVPWLNKGKKGMNDMSKGMRSTLGTTGAMSRMFRTLAISARFMIASMIFTGAINFVKNGFTDLYNYGGRTAEAMLSLKNALAGLRGSFAAAFAPILNFVAPALNYLIGLLTAAMNAIARFFAVLTGASTYEKASFGAEGFEAAGGAAGGANKKAKEYQKTLLGFDKINKLNEEPKSSGGGGGGGGSTTEATWKEAIAKSKFADMVKDAWKVGDFTDVGKYVAEQLADALEKIPWTRIKANAQKIGESIATFINGACEVPKLWEEVGSTIAEGINTAIRLAYGFVRKINATDVANAISTAISTALTTIEWDTLAYTIVTGIAKIIKTVAKTLAGLDYIEIGKSIIGGIGKGIKDSLADDPSNILGLTLITLFITNKMRKLVADIRKGFMGSTKGVDIPAPKTTGWGKVGEVFKSLKDKLETIYLYALDVVPKIGTKFGELIAWITGTGVEIGTLGGVLTTIVAPVAIFGGALVTAGIAIKGFKDHWGETIQDFKTNDPTGYAKTYGQSLHEMSGYAESGLTGFDATAKRTLGKGGTIPNAMINTSSEAETFKTKVLEKWNALKNSDAWQTIKTHINDNMSKAKESGTKSNNSLTENVVKGWQDAKESIKKIVGKIKDMFDFKWKLPKLPQFELTWETKSKGGFTVNVPHIRAYAKGGFPEEGPFMMNRGEIAGKFGNGKGVVANNQQITDAFADAIESRMYRAIVSGMRVVGGGEKDVIVRLEGDADKLFKVVRDKANQHQQATGQFAFDF